MRASPPAPRASGAGSSATCTTAPSSGSSRCASSSSSPRTSSGSDPERGAARAARARGRRRRGARGAARAGARRLPAAARRPRARRGAARGGRALGARRSSCTRTTSAATRTEVESAVYFCVMEALQNVGQARHAAPGPSCVTLDGDDARASCASACATTAPGASAIRAGAGITNMRDRLAAIGGELEVDDPRPGSARRCAAARRFPAAVRADDRQPACCDAWSAQTLRSVRGDSSCLRTCAELAESSDGGQLGELVERDQHDARVRLGRRSAAARSRCRPSPASARRAARGRGAGRGQLQRLRRPTPPRRPARSPGVAAISSRVARRNTA